MTKISLLATDLDGTVIGPAEDLHTYSVARDRINDLRDRNGMVWVVCTGRSLHSFKSFFAPMRIMDAVPDFVIARHAYIYGNRSFGYTPHVLWNIGIRRLLAQDRRHVWQAVKQWHLLVVKTYAKVIILQRKPDRLWIQFRSDKTAAAAEELLRPAVAAYRHMQIFRYSRELDIRAVPFTKGLALSELASHLGVERSGILAIGDGHNDISMLDGSTAGMVGCPGNSAPEVVETVHNAGGHIAGARSLEGAIEVIDAYCSGTVCSDLPRWWQRPAERENPAGNHKSRKHGRKRRAKSIWAGIAIVYVVILVFAHFGIIPFGISRFLMKPFDWMETLLRAVMGLFYR